MHARIYYEQHDGPGPGGRGPNGRGGRRPGGRGPGGRGGGRGRRGHGHGGRRRNRVSRGEIRAAVLILLTEQPMHGYQVMQEMEERSGGGWQPSPGSIYPTLQLLADEGLIVSEASEGKNVFQLTTAGSEAASAIDEPPVWERIGAEGGSNLINLRRGMMQLAAATKQVAAAGTEAQIEAAGKILNDARKSLYKLLAEDDED